MGYATRDDAIADLFAYIEFLYNRRHRHSTLGYKSPTQFLCDGLMTRHERKTAALCLAWTQIAQNGRTN